MNGRNEKNIRGVWVHFHFDEDWRDWFPSINVKCYRYPQAIDLFPDMKETKARRMGNLAWDNSINTFWIEAQEIANQVWGEGAVTVCACGRSGGWCSIFGLQPHTEWNKRTVNRWQAFEARIGRLYTQVTSPEFVKESIDDILWDNDPHWDNDPQYNEFEYV